MKRFLKEFLGFSLASVIAIGIILHAQQSAPLGPYGNTGWQITTLSAQTPTLAGNQMIGEIITTFGGATTMTTASATDICALFPFVGSSGSQGFAYDLYVKSAAGNTNVIPTGGSGVTIVGLGTNAASTVRHWKVVLNACPIPGTTSPTGAVTMHSLETTTF